MSSTSYPQSAEDWRGRFIANLAAGLGRRKDVKLDIWAPPGDLPPGVGSAMTPEEATWLNNLAQCGGIAHLLRNDKRRATTATVGLLRRLRSVYRRHHADVIHVNWLQNVLPMWGTRTPAIISVLGTDFGLLRLPGMTSLLRSVFKQRHTILAPNAEWMVAELRQSFGDVAQIQTVPFGVDDAWFALERRPPADNKHHWLTITRLTTNKVGDLFEWGAGLFGTNRLLHLFGPMQETLTLPDWVRYHGSTYPAELLDNWFPQASGLITLSRHDEGRPQVILEAMASGLPVIASNLPAHRDIIHHRQTGWLAETQEDFGEALHYMEQSSNGNRIGQAARMWVKQDTGTWDDCAARYATLYGKLLESRS